MNDSGNSQQANSQAQPEASHEEHAADRMKARAEEMKEKLLEGASTLGDKVSEFAAIGLEALKTGAQKATQVASDTSRLAKLKVDIHNLETERQKLHVEAGRKLWQLHSTGRLNEAETELANKLQIADKAQQQLAGLQQEVASLAAQ